MVCPPRGAMAPSPAPGQTWSKALNRLEAGCPQVVTGLSELQFPDL